MNVNDPDIFVSHRRRWAAAVAGVGMAAGATFGAALIGLAVAPAASADDQFTAVSDLIYAIDPQTFDAGAPTDLLGGVGWGTDALLDTTYLNYLADPVVDAVAGTGFVW